MTVISGWNSVLVEVLRVSEIKYVRCTIVVPEVLVVHMYYCVLRVLVIGASETDSVVWCVAVEQYLHTAGAFTK